MTSKPPRTESIFYEKLGRRLRQQRVMLRLTQTALAKRSGIDRSHIALLENAKGKMSLQTLRSLCRALGIRPSEILTGLR